MNQAVIIKSSRNGIILVLNPDMAFEDLLTEILNKFQESEKFFSNAEFAISFEGRDLSEEQKNQIVDCIMTHTGVKILCILENDEIRDAIIRQKLKEQTAADENPGKQVTGSFYYGSLAAGEHLETDESTIIIGDVPRGASVVSKADVVVLGSLRGTVYAGMDGAANAFIAALEFAPEKYNIAGIYGEMVSKEKSGFFPKRNKAPEAKIAVAEDGFIIVRPLYEGLNN